MQIQSFSANHIDATIVLQTSSSLWRLIGFYGSLYIEQREHTWAFFKHLKHQTTLS